MKDFLDKINSPTDLKHMSLDDLTGLATQIRKVVVEHVASKGGHLASNLGAVELTLALHKVYDTPRDKLIWDVGHQAYPHKLITGRYRKFNTLKQYGGLSGFLSREESEYDAFISGHASTSLAASMGFAVARTQQNKNHQVVAVIGDGSMTGGLAYEALNNAGDSKENITFVLNDNTMSIAPNVGAVHKYLTRLIANPTYNKLKNEVWQLTGKMPNMGEIIRKIVSKVDESVKHMVLPGSFFEDLGIRYFGSVRGHNLEELIDVFQQVKNISGPRLVHVLTEKGHGWERAEQDAYKWHASTPFHLESGQKKKAPGAPSLASVFGESLLEIAKTDDKVVAITAAMPDGTGVEIIQNELPDRAFDVGIAEQYAVTFAAGMACEGMKPFVAIYSCFLQRAVDQIIHDVALQKLPVVFALSHSGLVGVDGPTHHGAMDLTYLRMIPNMVIMAPSDEVELRHMVHAAYQYEKGPCAVRFPKGSVPNNGTRAPYENIEMGKPRIVEEGEDLLILCAGHMLNYGKEAAALLEKDGLTPTLADARFVKPLDPECYRELISRHSAVLTVEDNVVSGGFGSGISELMAKLGLFNIPVKHLGLPDEFVTHGDIPTLHANLGIDAQGVYKQAHELHKLVQTKSL